MLEIWLNIENLHLQNHKEYYEKTQMDYEALK